MVYKVKTSREIGLLVEEFSIFDRIDWNLCISRISDYPFAKTGDHFLITAEVALSGEELFVFSADWVRYRIVHVARQYAPPEFILNEGYEGEAIIFNLRDFNL